MNFFKFKKDKLPPLKSLRLAIFDVYKYWFISLFVVLIIFLVTLFLAIKFFYLSYSESYKKKVPAENFDNLINIKKINELIQKRETLFNQEIEIPRDPSV